VDCVALPARHSGRDQERIAFRAGVIRCAIETFAPDALIVDHLPLGTARELAPTLEYLRTRGRTLCLGLRDVLEDASGELAIWSDPAVARAVRTCYDAIWVYGDPFVRDPVRDHAPLSEVGSRVRYTGYLGQRLRLANAEAVPFVAGLSRGRLMLCDGGSGPEGSALTEAFVQAELPPDATGVAVIGPGMAADAQARVRQHAQRHPSMKVLDFVPDLAPLIHRADRVIAMGGYNTVCEMLSFEKRALIVPRVSPTPEQWIRARRMQQLGVLDVLHPDDLSPAALSVWLASDLGARPSLRHRIDLGGLTRIPTFLGELLGVAIRPRRPEVAGSAARAIHAPVPRSTLPFIAAARRG
jgi:predicted glycosyltransferase